MKYADLRIWHWTVLIIQKNVNRKYVHQKLN